MHPRQMNRHQRNLHQRNLHQRRRQQTPPQNPPPNPPQSPPQSPPQASSGFGAACVFIIHCRQPWTPLVPRGSIFGFDAKTFVFLQLGHDGEATTCRSRLKFSCRAPELEGQTPFPISSFSFQPCGHTFDSHSSIQHLSFCLGSFVLLSPFSFLFSFSWLLLLLRYVSTSKVRRGKVEK